MKPRARVPIEGLVEGERILDAKTSHYLATVLRLRASDTLVAFDPRRGLEAEGRVARVHRGVVVLELGTPRAGATHAPRPVTWIQGLAKGEKMDAIVRDATELGATRFVPAATEFAVVHLDRTRLRGRVERWARIAGEASRQCGRAEAPAIDPPLEWPDALAAAGSDDVRFCLYERAEAPLGPRLLVALSGAASLAFAVGPEGGLSPREVTAAEAAGYEVVSLGKLVLRTETVAAAVLGAVRILDSLERGAGSRGVH